MERPLRIKGADPERAYKPAEIKALKEDGKRGEDAPAVIRKIHKAGVEADPIHGLFEATIDGKTVVVEYEPDSDLRDTEQIQLQEDGGIEAFLAREVLPYAPDAWHRPDSVKIGYEISFHAVLLQSRADADAGGDSGRYSRVGTGDRGGGWGRFWAEYQRDYWRNTIRPDLASGDARR